ncbi:hypothetical protein KCMC57_up49600 [Kitasatospora sp. CMC57]
MATIRRRAIPDPLVPTGPILAAPGRPVSYSAKPEPARYTLTVARP